jgi:hypothetical protein
MIRGGIGGGLFRAGGSSEVGMPRFQRKSRLCSRLIRSSIP